MKRSVLLVGVAVLLAAVGVLSVLYYVRQADERALAGQRAVSVLVAAAAVPAGTSAADAQAAGLLRTEVMPADTVPTDALGSVGPEVADLVTGADLQPGQIVLRSLFGKAKPASSGLPIPEGKVALSLALGVTEQVAGYVRTGSEVAVLQTTAVTGAGAQKDGTVTTRVLLPRIEVLAVGPAPAGQSTQSAQTTTEPAADPAAPKEGRIMLTFAVDTAQAQRLVLAAQTGTLHLALLTDDSAVTPDAGVNTGSLFDSANEGG